MIPSFSIDGNFSEAISIDVDENSSSVTQTDLQIYTETSLDKPKVHTQQQAVVTWRLVSRMGAPQVRFAPPHINGVMTQDLGNRSYQRASSNGGSEWVIEQRYALFPQQSGNIKIPSQTFQVLVNETQRHLSGFLISTPTEITRNTEEKQLEVIPPPNTSNHTWLPASDLEIFQQITGLDAQSQATAGTAFTRTIRIRAKGLSAEQLPKPDMQASNVKIYAEPPVFDNKAGSQGNIGMREDRAAVIAMQAGTLVLPAIHIGWYDTETSQWRSAILEESTINVLPNPNAPAQQINTEATPPDTTTAKTQTSLNTNAQPTSNTTPNTYLWQILVGVLVLCLLLLAAYIYYLQRKVRGENLPTKPITSTKKNAGTTDIQQIIASGNLRNLYQYITQWAITPERKAILAQPDAQAALQTLEKHLYGNGVAPTTEILHLLTEMLSRQDSPANQPTKESHAQLGSLY